MIRVIKPPTTLFIELKISYDFTCNEEGIRNRDSPEATIMPPRSRPVMVAGSGVPPVNDHANDNEAGAGATGGDWMNAEMEKSAEAARTIDCSTCCEEARGSVQYSLLNCKDLNSPGTDHDQTVVCFRLMPNGPPG